LQVVIKRGSQCRNSFITSIVLVWTGP